MSPNGRYCCKSLFALLVETVIGVQQMRGSKEWGPEEIEKALSPEALTSSVMQRYHVYIACRRDLGASSVSLLRRQANTRTTPEPTLTSAFAGMR